MVAFCYSLSFAFDKAETAYAFSGNILNLVFIIPNLVVGIGSTLGQSHGAARARSLSRHILCRHIARPHRLHHAQALTRQPVPFLPGSFQSTSCSALFLLPMPSQAACSRLRLRPYQTKSKDFLSQPHSHSRPHNSWQTNKFCQLSSSCL